ncbi:hypothetical protein NBRC110019_16800 [Neptunitalea chrysea]|uniref:Uncharacterized protein n=1 Tax=Neptunitalea chrysea TaxID=1647581 RepID=A0A9W6ETV6_9FLAO|nr:hypothetical protein [Neptunitalea chrysea]GLB52640.1 hypothetical protein NBRC110019_16800 [Neptunitalea chrysea]
MYKYRGYEMKIFREFVNKKSERENICNGYVGVDKKWIEKDYKSMQKLLENDTVPFNSNIYKKGIDVFEEILHYADINNVKVLMIWSPYYIEFSNFHAENKKYLDSLYESYEINERVNYLNFSEDSLANHMSNFYNSAHLNGNGSKKFSKKIGLILKRDFSNL